MTALWLDGFDHYGPGGTGLTNMLDGAYAQVGAQPGPGVPSFGARTGEYALSGTQVTYEGASYFGGYRYVLPASQAKLFASFGFAVNNLPTNNFLNQICSFCDSGNNIIASLFVQSTGAIVLADASDDVLATTQGPVIVASNWHLIEFEYDETDQTFTLRVDDASGTNTPAIAATGLSLSGSVYQLRLLDAQEVSGGPAPAVTWMDDLFIRNASGSVNNSWLGDRRVTTMFADADTTTMGWTPNFYQKLGAGILNNTFVSGTQGGAAWANSGTQQNLGSGDFTIETFVRFKTLPTGAGVYSTIFGKWDETFNERSYQLFLGSTALNNGNLCWRYSTDGTTVVEPISYPWTPNLDQWYNVAIVRASGQDLLFIDGIQQGLPQTDSATYFNSTAIWQIGGKAEVPGPPTVSTSLDGWFDELRLTVGFARYTTNFTPTTVEFPRGSSDPHWADIGLLCGFDTAIVDESSFATAMSEYGAVQQTVSDGPSVGNWSTLGTTKQVPDDNTFMSAPFIPATSVLTVTVNPSNGNTVTVGTKNGSTAAVYTFKTAITTAFDVLIDTNIQNSLQNLFNAINTGSGAGTKYGTGTTANFDVNAIQLPAGQMKVSANIPGTGGNSIATSVSGITGSWTGSTLSGGVNIPGPSNFLTQRLPPTTTIISAIQINTRSYKSDAGAGSINTAFIGPLGGVVTGPTHSLTVSPVYYGDIYETDPDTSGPISPTTLTSGKIEINRDA